MAKRPRGRPKGSPVPRQSPGAAVVAEAAAPPDFTLVELLTDLEELRFQRQQLDEDLEATVRDARAAGATWSAIAARLGVTPQAVQKRWGRG